MYQLKSTISRTHLGPSVNELTALTYRAQMVAVISLLCSDTKAGGSMVTSNFGSTVGVQKKTSENKTQKTNKPTIQSPSGTCESSFLGEIST